MAFTELTLAQRALEAMGANESQIPLPRITSRIPDALELLARRVKESPRYHEMQKDFAVTPASGIADLSALSGILFDIHRSKVKVTATAAMLRAADSLLALESNTLPNDQVYYAEDGRTLRFRSTTPALNDYATPVTIRANFIPQSLAEVPSQFDPLLPSILAELLGVGAAVAGGG